MTTIEQRSGVPTGLPDIRPARQSEAEMAAAYAAAGWRVGLGDNLAVIYSGSTTGLVAVRGPKVAVRNVPQMNGSWYIDTDDGDVLVLFKRPSREIRRTVVKQGVNVPETWGTDAYGSDNTRTRYHRLQIEFEVLPDGSEVHLPPTPGTMWTSNPDAELLPLPPWLDVATRSAPKMVEQRIDLAPATPRQEGPGGLVTEGQVSLLFGAPGIGITTLALGMAVEHLADEAAQVVFLDYDGLGPEEVGARLAAMGLNDPRRFTYVDTPDPVTEPTDLEHLLNGRVLVIVDSLPGQFLAHGTTDRLPDHVAPVMRVYRQLARKHRLMVVMTDESKDRRVPRGSRDKIGLSDAAFYVKELAPIADRHDGLLAVESVGKGRTDRGRQLVAVRTQGALTVEFHAADETLTKVRADLLREVAAHPRQLSKEGLTRPDYLAGSRDLRRRVAEELVAEGVLQVVRVTRSERGRKRRQDVYDLAEGYQVGGEGEGV